MWVWPCIVVNTWKLKGQLDATDWFLYCKIYCSLNTFRGTIMPIIRSSRVMQMVAACGTWRFGLQVVGLVWSCGLCVRFAGCFSCPSSGAQELCRWLLPVVLGALVYRSLVWFGAVGYVSGLRDVPQFHTSPTTCKPKRQVPQAATICITLKLLMMGIMVPRNMLSEQ